MSIFNSWVYRVRQWIRNQIVDDDPWDEATLFPDAQDPRSEPSDAELPDSKPPANAEQTDPTDPTNTQEPPVEP